MVEVVHGFAEKFLRLVSENSLHAGNNIQSINMKPLATTEASHHMLAKYELLARDKM